MLAILVALNRTVATLSAAACLSRRDIFVFAAIRSVVWLPRNGQYVNKPTRPMKLIRLRAKEAVEADEAMRM
jgi:hypothetical protein